MITNKQYPADGSAGLNNSGSLSINDLLSDYSLWNRIALWITRHFRWILLVMMCLQIMKGTAVYEGPYARAHYLWNYDAGFVKRGLIGSLAFYLAEGSKYRMLGIINFISYLLYFSFMFLLYRFIVKHAVTATQQFVSLLLHLVRSLSEWEPCWVTTMLYL